MVDSPNNEVRRKSMSDRSLLIGIVGLGLTQFVAATVASGFSLAKILTMRQNPPVVVLHEKIAPPAFATTLSVGEQNVFCPVILQTTPERTTAIVPRYCLDDLKPE